MQHLRIVGVGDEENQNQLILSDDEGNEYSLPVDDALRSAAGRAARQSASAEDSSAPLSPREIQARLRAGASVDQVVEESGLDPRHVQRYAGPVQAERSYIAQRARSTEVAAASTAEHHRLAFGDAPASLEAMVKVRLRALEVELKTVSWDAWRREDGRWQVECWFDVGSSESHGDGVGLQPPAEWTFTAETRQLTAANRWAESLNTLPLPGKSRRRGSSRHLAAVDAPFDVDAAHSPAPDRDRGAGAARQNQNPATARPAAETPAQSPQTPAEGSSEEGAAEGGEHEHLLDVLRARRGQRLGTDEESDEKLALMLTREEQSADAAPEPRLRAVEAQTHEPDSDPDEQLTGPVPGLEDGGVSADRSEDGDEQSAPGTDAWGFSYEEGVEEAEEPPADQAPEQKEPEQQDQDPEPRHRKRSSSRRPSMPKWDDILFGGKD